MNIVQQPIQFQWDKGNQDKNLIKHKVIKQECEEVFFDQNKKMFKDAIHSQNEDRHIIIGKTKQKRLLFIVFTIQGREIRVISARDLNRKEKMLYEKTA
ncbi:MAG: BrnT family toxin [Patescibacteria group bacterium]